MGKAGLSNPMTEWLPGSLAAKASLCEYGCDRGSFGFTHGWAGTKVKHRVRPRTFGTPLAGQIDGFGWVRYHSDSPSIFLGSVLTNKGHFVSTGLIIEDDRHGIVSQSDWQHHGIVRKASPLTTLS